MKVLVLFVRIPKSRIVRLTRLLHQNTAQIGMTIIAEGVHTESSSVSSDPIASFTWQAPACILPAQIIAIMEYCTRVGAMLLEMNYMEDVEDDDDDITDEPPALVIPLRTHATSHLRLIINEDESLE